MSGARPGPGTTTAAHRARSFPEAAIAPHARTRPGTAATTRPRAGRGVPR